MIPAGSLPGKAELVHIAIHWTVLLDSTKGQTTKNTDSVLGGDKCYGEKHTLLGHVGCDRI